MNTISVRRVRRFGIFTRYGVFVRNYRVKTHASLEAASWHAFALGSSESTRLALVRQTVDQNDTLWAGRC